ncbi:hypothetical protein DesfrDRAFT_0828 [Solidesulfovibrio fructosivorans JJ]]|uniref:Uncharacterized protein n=1 Tax=Solidesulfovibrio fructosivorans JJ] TaxID=596151 RepID=E1JT79_SOLFR|nr:hypothetical protein [Solidesulfovibrio fructosivorans]EFL52339.1 hypothetical protein DesfrDRAFT_0828 [Solidesulfovibrio fructosivorans JJ]]
MDAYWYISDDKIKILKQDLNKFKLKDIVFKLKIPFFEASMSTEKKEILVRDLKDVEKAILSQNVVPEFQDLPMHAQNIFFSFQCKGARRVGESCYWVASVRGDTALLLAGSATNGIGSMPPETKEELSPSLDPIGTILKVFQGAKEDDSISEALSFAWQAIIRTYVGSFASLPKVQGLAIGAGVFSSYLPQIRRAGQKNIQKIVVGTPIYIRQM